jgi:hypothetical protein
MWLRSIERRQVIKNLVRCRESDKRWLVVLMMCKLRGHRFCPRSQTGHKSNDRPRDLVAGLIARTSLTSVTLSCDSMKYFLAE